jgi:anti-anti-sigma factor
MTIPVIEIAGNKIEIFKFNKHLDNLYQKKDIKVICIDARKCDYLNSYTLGAIIYYYSLMMKQDRKIVMMLSDDRENYMRRLFETSGLDKLFDVIKNLEEIKA